MRDNSTSLESQQTNIFGKMSFFILLLILINISFLRGFRIPWLDLSTTYMIIIFTISSFLLVLYTQKLKVNRRILFIFWLLILSILLVTLSKLFLFDSDSYTLRLSFEMILNLVIFVTTIQLTEHVDVKKLIFAYIFVSMLFSSYILYAGVIDMETVRRVRVGTVGINHISHSIGLGTLASIVYFKRENHYNWMFFSASLIMLSSLLLTGTRSVLLGVFICIVALILVSGKERIVKNLFSVIAVGVTVITVIVVLADFSDGGIRRLFNIQDIVGSLNHRIDTYVSYLSILFDNNILLLVGVDSINYGPIAPESLSGIGPHNFLISSLLFLGIPTTILIFFLLFDIVRYGTCKFLSSDSDELIIILLSLLLIFVYSFFSGNLTRIFTIWFFLGLVIGESLKYNTYTGDV